MDNLIVAIYVDTNALLDLLASIEGGFSIVEKVTTRTTTTSGSDKSVAAEAGTEFGIPNVLNLLKIKLTGSLSSRREEGSGEEVETERYHTYGSLLYRLRGFLDSENLIKRPYEEEGVWETIEPSDFIEVRGVFRPNPVTGSLECIDRLIGIFEVVSRLGSFAQRSSGGGKRAQGGKKEMKEFRQFLEGILSDVERENTKTFIIDANDVKAFPTVVLLFTDYLRDQSMTEISHKEYRLLGKVVRKIDEGGEVIDLLRGTGLGGIGKEMLGELWRILNQMEGMNLSEVTSEVSGPAVEVVPIAIFI